MNEQQLKMLEDCKTAADWRKACDAIKDSTGIGMYPDDWFEKVVQSGMMDRITARWGEDSSLKVTVFDRLPRDFHKMMGKEDAET